MREKYPLHACVVALVVSAHAPDLFVSKNTRDNIYTKKDDTPPLTDLN